MAGIPSPEAPFRQVMKSITFDIGGTHLRAGIVSATPSGTHVVRRPVRERVAERLEDRKPAQVWEQVRTFILNYVQSVEAEVARDSPIAATFPGPVDDQGNILGAPTCQPHK